MGYANGWNQKIIYYCPKNKCLLIGFPTGDFGPCGNVYRPAG